jgi:transforming growth factor-beta-induced protein
MKKLSHLLIAVLTFTFVFTACNQQEDVVAPEPDLQDIPTTLENFNEELSYSITDPLEDFSSLEEARKHRKRYRVRRIPTFFTLFVALKKTDLFTTVVRNKLTVFAPTDAAFASLGIYPWNVGRVPDLDKILLYHVVDGKVFSRDLSEGFVPTLNGAAVEVSFNNGIFINESEVIRADLRALNGVIHVIDRVLLPPTNSIVDIVVGTDRFSILRDALIKADLVGAFTDDVNYTVFAPNNDAFIDLLGELGFASLDDIPVDILTNVLLYHVVDGRVFSSDLSDGLMVNALNGGTITFDLSGAPSIVDENGRVAPLETSALNIQATNGVIHELNRVILPTL